MAKLDFEVNGKAQSVDADPDTPLLFILQDDLQLNGPKFGCGLAQCGACTVLLDGEPIRSCTTSASEAVGKKILTLEGLGTVDNPHPIQQAFIDTQAVQCGFCLSGPVLYGKAFLDKNPNATEAQIFKALDGLLCRCHTHVRMVQALAKYARGARA